MDKVRIGVVGVGRGSSMMQYCAISDDAVLVAICDKWEEGLAVKKRELGDSITYYTDYDEFLNHDMDAVVLANYATEHAPFAIKAMNKGFHVISEVLPCQTMKEAVELIETIEHTGKIYCYLENYCYMPGPYEMKKAYREGKIGEFEYGEGEYIHNCEPIWPQITNGDPEHWRNNTYATFYCTHSIGPLIHITGLRPVSVVGFEIPFNERNARMGCKSGAAGIEMITLENGAVIKSIHGGLSRDSIWYSIYGKKGHMETSRESADAAGIQRLFFEAYPEDGDYSYLDKKDYRPMDENTDVSKTFGHGGSDYYSMLHCMNKILGHQDADTIDIYEALDMYLPGMFAYRSVLQGGIPLKIPNLRNKEERDLYRNDTTCTYKDVAGEMYIPSYSKGNPEIEDEIYDQIRKKR